MRLLDGSGKRQQTSVCSRILPVDCVAMFMCKQLTRSSYFDEISARASRLFKVRDEMDAEKVGGFWKGSWGCGMGPQWLEEPVATGAPYSTAIDGNIGDSPRCRWRPSSNASNCPVIYCLMQPVYKLFPLDPFLLLCTNRVKGMRHLSV